MEPSPTRPQCGHDMPYLLCAAGKAVPYMMWLKEKHFRWTICVALAPDISSVPVVERLLASYELAQDLHNVHHIRGVPELVCEEGRLLLLGQLLHYELQEEWPRDWHWALGPNDDAGPQDHMLRQL